MADKRYFVSSAAPIIADAPQAELQKLWKDYHKGNVSQGTSFLNFVRNHGIPAWRYSIDCCRLDSPGGFLVIEKHPCPVAVYAN